LLNNISGKIPDENFYFLSYWGIIRGGEQNGSFVGKVPNKSVGKLLFSGADNSI
jgi:hypothetical protein